MFKQLLASAAIVVAGGATPSATAPDRATTMPKAGTTASLQGERPSGRQRPGIAPLTLRIEVDVPGLAPGATVQAYLLAGNFGYSSEHVLPAVDVALPSGPGDEMVRLGIAGPDGEQYRTILGSRRLLEQLAGADRVLDAGELDRVRTGPLSTSLAVSIQRALGDRDPVSDLEHQRAVRAIASDVFLGAAFLEAVRTGAATLPANTRGIELLADGAAFRDWLRLNPGAVSAEAVADVAARPTGIPLQAGALGASTALLPAQVLGELQMRQPHAQLLFRDGKDFALHYGNYTSPDAGATVTQLDDGAIAIDPDGEPAMHAYSFVNTPTGNEQVLTRYVLERIVHRKLFASARHDLWSSVLSFRQSYPGRADLAPVLATSATTMFTVRLDNDLGLRARTVAGRYALPRFCQGPDPAGVPSAWSCEYVDTTLSPGGTGLRRDVGTKITGQYQPRSGPFTTMPVAWTLGGDGTLRIADALGEAVLWRVDREDRGADAMVYLARVMAGDTPVYVAGQTSMMPVDPMPPAYATAASVVGQWAFGSFQVADGTDVRTAPTTARFRRSADGVVVQTTLTALNPPVTATLRSGWQLFPVAIDGQPINRLYDTRYAGLVGGGTRSFASCAEAKAAGATACRPDRVRYLRPLRQVGARTYGIEEVYLNTAGYNQAPVVTLSSRAGWYERLGD